MSGRARSTAPFQDRRDARTGRSDRIQVMRALGRVYQLREIGVQGANLPRCGPELGVRGSPTSSMLRPKSFGHKRIRVTNVTQPWSSAERVCPYLQEVSFRGGRTLMVPDGSKFFRFTVGAARLFTRGALWGVAVALTAVSAWIFWLIMMGGGGSKIATWAAALVVPGVLFSLIAQYQRKNSRADRPRGIYPSSAAPDSEHEKTASSSPGTDSQGARRMN